MNANNSRAKCTTVVLVDDDDVDARSVERALKKLKVVNPLIRAHDGIEALDLLRQEVVASPYLILLDLNMPRMNGLEFLDELRSDPELSGSVVFVLTTSGADEDIVAAYGKHVAGYIVKRQIEGDFLKLIETLDAYWRVIEFPSHK